MNDHACNGTMSILLDSGRGLLKRGLVLMAVGLMLVSCHCVAEVVPAKYFSDGMVLQRDEPITVWGRADAGEDVRVEFLDTSWQTRADKAGHWELDLPAQTQARGLQMQIGDRVIRDIAIGDVWLASGQSNMAFKLHHARSRFPEELELAHYPDIRQFLVRSKVNFKRPQRDFSVAAWRSASRQSVSDFSAVAWFFAKELSVTQDVTIGIINASVGATPVESWMSFASLDEFPERQDIVKNFADDTVLKSFRKERARESLDWANEARRKDAGLDTEVEWSTADLDDSAWKTLQIPGTLKSRESGFTSGVVWLRREVHLDEKQAGADLATLQMGLLVDEDETFVNGHLVGSTPTRYAPRSYTVPAGVLKPGRNIISVRLQVKRNKGGAVKGEAYQLQAGRDVLELKGSWKYRIGSRMPPRPKPDRLETRPTGLYNAMIAPAHRVKIKGFIWYQGESNTRKPQEYAALFSSMITDWRHRWEQGSLPFLFVQLANYMMPTAQPEEASWAELRQAQTEVEAMLPNTAMAVAIDVGERHDIHPLDKKTVGQRLAYCARALAYGEKDMTCLSPKAVAVTRKGNELVVSFERIGRGLTMHGESLKGFALAGADGKFVWAKAKLEDNRAVVWSEILSEPVRVRYAWAQNPEDANLYNMDGLPAVPFNMAIGD